MSTGEFVSCVMRIIYIDCDSLRPDHLGCYGYRRDTSPHIDALAEDGRIFTNYYASDVPCLPSRTALFTGRFGFHTGVVNHGGRNADPRCYGDERGFTYPERYRSWFRVFGERGLHTVSISSFPHRHDGWQILEGVHEFYDTGKNGLDRADEVYPTAERWLAHNAENDDWFLHLNFWDPHTPYDTPQSYGNPFEDQPAPDWLTEERIHAQYESYGPHGARETHGIGPDFGGTRNLPRMPNEINSREAFKQWVDGYDVGVHYFDEYVGRLVDTLRQAGIFEETLIIISADHGENLGELNVYGDHHTADDKTCRVPLIFRGPQVDPGTTDTLHYHLDLPPTITELLGGEPPSGWDGRSFASAVTEGAGVGRKYLILSQGAWACQRGVRWGDWLLLRTYHDGLKEALDDVMLFELANDPYELTDLSQDRPEEVERGLSLLQRWIDERMIEAWQRRSDGNPGSSGAGTDPIGEVLREGGPFHTRGHVEPYARRLRNSGREEHANRLLEEHGQSR